MFVEASDCCEGVFNGRLPQPVVKETPILECVIPDIQGQVRALIVQEKLLSFCRN